MLERTMDTENAKCFSKIFKEGPCEGLDKLSDITLRTCDGYAFKAHRVFLSQKSDYFKALFCSEIGGDYRSDVLISDTKGQILDLIICYMYTGEINLDDSNVKDVLIAADFYLMDDLLKICETVAITCLNSSNCISILLTAWKVTKANILHFCHRYVLVHFDEIVSTSLREMKHMPFDSLQLILSSKNLNVHTELTVWKVIVEWVLAKPTDRYRYVPDLVACFPLENMDEHLAREIINHPIVKGNSYCERISISNFPNCEVIRNHILGNFNLSSRVPENLHIVACLYEAGSEIYATYDEYPDFWRHISMIDFHPETIVCVCNLIYFIDVLSDCCIALDPTTDVFLPLRYVFVHRTSYIVVSTEDKIYAIGGLTDSEWTSYQLDCYDGTTQSWSELSSFSPMTLSAAEVLDGRIIAIGDDFTEHGTSTMIAQMYDPQTNQWSMISPPNRFRHDFAISVFNNELYILGGQDFETYLRDIEVYNLFNDEWQFTQPLPLRFCTPRAYVFRDILVVAETKYGGASPAATWDGVDMWKVVPHSKRLHEYIFCTIQNHQLVKDITVLNRSKDNNWIRSIFTL